MAYCTECGTVVEDNMQFCTNCGTPIQRPNAQPDAQQNAQNTQQYVQQDAQANAQQYAQNTQQYVQPDAQQSSYAPEDIAQNKGKAALSYLGILILVPVILAKDSAFAKFHINQGLLLLIASVATEVLSQIAKWLDLSFLSGIVGLLAIVVFVFRIIGIVWAAQGKAKSLPLLDGIQLIK